MKKYLLLAIGLFSFGQAMALEGEALIKHTEDKLNKHEINEVYNGQSNLKRTYLGEEWTVLELHDSYKTYAVIDGGDHHIQKLRIVSEYCESCLGKEILFLENKYNTKGRLLDSDILEIHDNSLKIHVYTDFDHIDGNTKEHFTIIDFSGELADTLRASAVHDIYYQKRMNRK